MKLLTVLIAEYVPGLTFSNSSAHGFTRYTNTSLLILFSTAQCDGLHSRAVLVVWGDETRLCETQRSTRYQRRSETDL